MQILNLIRAVDSISKNIFSHNFFCPNYYFYILFFKFYFDTTLTTFFLRFRFSIFNFFHDTFLKFNFFIYQVPPSRLLQFPLVDVPVNDDFLSAPGAALPENGLLRLFISI